MAKPGSSVYRSLWSRLVSHNVGAYSVESQHGRMAGDDGNTRLWVDLQHGEGISFAGDPRLEHLENECRLYGERAAAVSVHDGNSITVWIRLDRCYHPDPA